MSPRKARRLAAEIKRRPRRGALPPAQGRDSRAGTQGGSGRAGGGAAAEPPAVRLGPPQVQEWPDGDWVVRQVPAAAASKTYRCPGCDQELRPGVAHVVVWPTAAPGSDERRHWHNRCWQRRPRRAASWQPRW